MSWRPISHGSAQAAALSAKGEFFPGATEWPDDLGRRDFLRRMAASIALASAAACTRQPLRHIVPYVSQPESILPGEPLFFSSSHLLGGYARGILVESHEGRPTKIEGNPDHSASLGSTDALMQASVLDLYDPDRSQSVMHGGQPSTWEDFQGALAGLLHAQQAKRGAGMRILTETLTSPSLLEAMAALRLRFPELQWIQYDRFSRGNAREGARQVFGAPVDPVYRFDAADVVVALDADFLAQGPTNVRYSRDFTARRRAALEGRPMSRLLVAEPCPTLTGVMADERLPRRATEMERLAGQLLAALAEGSRPEDPWTAHAAAALQVAKGRGIVVAGDDQPPQVHALVGRLNGLLGNLGKTVSFVAPLDSAPAAPEQALSALAEELDSGGVEILLILGGNPVYHAPSDVDFGRAVERAPFCAHLSQELNETSARALWHLPEAHFLESWGDARGFDGVVSFVQPLIAPLYGGRTASELLQTVLGDPSASGFSILREYWRAQGVEDSAWRAALARGFLLNTAAPIQTLPPRKEGAASAVSPGRQAAPAPDSLEVALRQDPNIYDGRYANNAWLQELPRPISTLSWDNAFLLSPATAVRRGFKTGDILEVRVGRATIRGPALITPGHAEDALTAHVGYGRVSCGRVGARVGFDAGALRTVSQPALLTNATVRGAGGRVELAFTQEHHRMEGRDLIRSFSNPGAMREAADFSRKHPAPRREETLYNPGEFAYQGYRWGMVIDLNTCIGCNACVIACQAENNIPVVGKEEVRRGREMHWIRIDSYYDGAEDRPRICFQPVPCMHCENAPCELVCPVGATVHDHEGLNVQVYNRCVGTRYCSNNCPYKVRRFNFFEYTSDSLENSPSRRLLRNPDVTVRSRGVMEKCTYCIQRISRARITAKKEDRLIRDGEVTPACAQACPALAITFGDIGDENSRVARLKTSPFDYAMLGELNTRPRTTYLARLSNRTEEADHA